MSTTVSTPISAPTSIPVSAVTATEIVMPGIVEPAGLQIRFRELPAPALGQALVRVEASGVSFAEHGMRRGRYPGGPKFPFIPGYDLVGTVQAVGDGVDPALVGQRVAAITEVGGWASHALLSAADLVPVPDGLDPAEVEAVLVNGVTAYQMLNRTARVRPGQTILVHATVPTAGWAPSWRSSPATTASTSSIPPRPATTTPCAASASSRSTTATPTAWSPASANSLLAAWTPCSTTSAGRACAARGAYWPQRHAGQLRYGLRIGNGTQSMVALFTLLLARLAWWNALHNGHGASFYDLWARNLAGRTRRPKRFRARMREDLTTVFGLLQSGVLTPQVAARFPLT